MIITELRDKRNKLIADAQAFKLKESMDATELETFERMLNDVDSLEKQIATFERMEKLEAEERSANPAARPNVNTNDKTEQRKKAFENYIRFGSDNLTVEDRSILREQRDVLTSGTGPAYLIPQDFYPTLVEAQKYVGSIVNEVTIKRTNNNGAPMKVSLTNDTSNTLVTLTEGTSLSTTDPSFTGFILSTDTVATLIKVSLQELEDSFFNLDQWFRKSFGVRYARGIDKFIVSGNGSNVASLQSGATLGATAAAATGPVYDDFVNCYGSLDEAYVPNAKWAMSQATRAQVMGLKDNYGRPLFIPSPNSGTLDMILGSPVVITPNLPQAYGNVSTTATVTGILYGDFSEGYVYRTDGDLSIVRLNERYMDSLEVGFIAYSRIGGAVTDAGTHPVLSLETPVA